MLDYFFQCIYAIIIVIIFVKLKTVAYKPNTELGNIVKSQDVHGAY